MSTNDIQIARKLFRRMQSTSTLAVPRSQMLVLQDEASQADEGEGTMGAPVNEVLPRHAGDRIPSHNLLPL